MKIDPSKHPDYKTHADIQTIEGALFQECIDMGVLLTPGSWFTAEKGSVPDMFFRATFASAPFDKINEAIKRFGEAIRKCYKLDS